MQPLSQLRPRLEVLNIFVPRGGAGTIATFVQGIGYEEQRTPFLLFKLTATYQWKVMRTFKKRSTTIICYESIGPSLLPLVLTGPCTAVMNAITATRLYSFYPTLTLDGRGVGGRHWPVNYLVDLYAKHGVHVSKPNEYVAGVACSYECRRLTRRIKGDEGKVALTWNVNGVKELPDALESEGYAWRLGGRCTNPSCQYRFQDPTSGVH
jgi:hypothetical protein